VDRRVQPGRGLTQHVRALETFKCRRNVAQPLCATSGLELGLDGLTDTVMETGHEFLLCDGLDERASCGNSSCLADRSLEQRG
jgi:hypothetical protein